MIMKLLAILKEKYWEMFLPFFTAHSSDTGNHYDYYMVYFVDVSRQKYRLARIITGEGVILEKWFSKTHHWTEKVTRTIPELNDMETQIIHYRKQGSLSFSSILLFSFSYYTRFLYFKNFISRTKGRFSSALFAKKEVKSRDRIALLNLLVNEYIRQKPAQVNTGVTTEEIIELLNYCMACSGINIYEMKNLAGR